MRTNFSNNNVSNGMGGAVHRPRRFRDCLHIPQQYIHSGNNIVNIMSCIFKENTARYGGVVTIYSSEISLQDEQSAVLFSDCSWTSNTAPYGAAVHVMPAIWPSETQSHYLLIQFSNSDVSSNTITPIVQKQGRLKI